jgi:hypothetical protein
MYTKTIYIILSFTLLTIGCSSQREISSQELSEIDWDHLQLTPRTSENLCMEISPEELNWDRLKQDFPYGLFGGIYPENTSNLEKLADGTLWVNANQQLSLKLRFWYPMGNDRSANLRFFVLLDERQLDKALPEPGVYNEINLERGDDIALELTIPPLENGIHDLIAIGIPYPQDYPNEHGIVRLISWRITLIAEPSSLVFRKIGFQSLPAEGSLKKNEPLIPLTLTLNEHGIDVWNWPSPWLDLKLNHDIEFFALAGHNYVDNLDAPNLAGLETSFFSLLLFMDYQQIMLAPNQVAFYGKVNQDTAYSRIPMKISSPPLGKHHLLVLRIDSPGVPMCLLKGDLTGRIFPNSIYGSLVGLDVISSK